MANKRLKVGPGGRRCACCFPPPRSRERRAIYRRAKRVERQAALREALTDAAAEEARAAELPHDP